MKLTEYFRLAIIACLNAEEWGSQTKLANALNINKTYFNQILNGDRKIGEPRREQIADYFGYKYEDLIKLGRILYKTSETLKESENIITKNINVNLYKTVRERQKYTKKEMAKLLKISEFEYNFKEKGVLPFTIEEICLIIKLTKEKPQEITFDNHSEIIKNIETESSKMSEEEKIVFFIQFKEKFSEEGKNIKECYKKIRVIQKNELPPKKWTRN